jgi:membrane protease YdiL (CAAX protease family)
MPEGHIESASSYVFLLDELKVVGWLYSLLLLASLVLGIFARTDASPWPEVIVSAIDALIILAFFAKKFDSVLALLKSPKIHRKEGVRILAIAIGFIALMASYFWLLKHLGIPLASVTETYKKAGWPFGIMALQISFMPAFFEELAFRGVIQTTLQNIFGEREALLIQAALFSVLHLSPLVFPSHFIMGFVFGYLRLRSGSLYPSIALHAIWNLFVLIQELY